MLTIALIRPGASEYECRGRVQGNLDVPLSSDGARQVEQVAQELSDAKLEVIYGSECQPAWQTAEQLAARLAIKAKSLDDMQNLDHGLWQGLLIDEIKRKQPKVYRQWQENPASVCPPEGETLADAQQRVQACLARLMKKHKQGRIGLVLPEPLASLVRNHFGQAELDDLWRAGAYHPPWEWIEAQAPAVTHRG